MTSFEQALSAGGAAAALMLGVATAQFGLAPLREAAATAAPPLDTMDADAPQRLQADLPDTYDAAPPAVIVPISVRAPLAAPADTVDGSTRSTDDARQAHGPEKGALDPSPDTGSSPESQPATQALDDGAQSNPTPSSVEYAPDEQGPTAPS